MKTTILEKAKKTLDARRFYAEKEALNNKSKALEDERFKKKYQDYISAMIENAKNGLGEDVSTIAKKHEYELMLSKLGIKSIEPDYFCKSCEDTGFVEGKYCKCLIDEINKILKEESGYYALSGNLFS